MDRTFRSLLARSYDGYMECTPRSERVKRSRMPDKIWSFSLPLAFLNDARSEVLSSLNS
jgi:hypothetical protein